MKSRVRRDAGLFLLCLSLSAMVLACKSLIGWFFIKLQSIEIFVLGLSLGELAIRFRISAVSLKPQRMILRG